MRARSSACVEMGEPDPGRARPGQRTASRSSPARLRLHDREDQRAHVPAANRRRGDRSTNKCMSQGIAARRRRCSATSRGSGTSRCRRRSRCQRQVDRRDRMVHEVPADPIERNERFDPEWPQIVRRTDAGAEEHGRAAVGAGGDDHCSRVDELARGREPNADRTPVTQLDAIDGRVRSNGEVRTGSSRSEIGECGARSGPRHACWSVQARHRAAPGSLWSSTRWVTRWRSSTRAPPG